MKNYTITVNGKSYEVTVEERGGASAPVTTTSAPVAPVVKAALHQAAGKGEERLAHPRAVKSSE